MELGVRDKVTLVTGGSKGIGLALIRRQDSCRGRQRAPRGLGTDAAPDHTRSAVTRPPVRGPPCGRAGARVTHILHDANAPRQSAGRCI